MIRDDSPEAVLARLETACLEIYRALDKGIKTADALHELAEWNKKADPHLHRQMTRREAMEELKQLNPELEDEDDLGLPMSGLIFHLSQDIIRVWHTQDINIPRPPTEAKRKFVSQKPERALPLEGLFDSIPGHGPAAEAEPAKNHMIIQWTCEGSEIARFDLVRPAGVAGAHVAVDWRQPLLVRYTQVQDLQYRRRDSKSGSGEEAAQ
ncbi:hypothetical protein [Nonomuraea sp. NPDC050310]|uniref:hypothetical protein n=1 Tax=Nonomuraea sp. NPDC050310 TaxID=3154935 RepID=UPI00340AD36E